VLLVLIVVVSMNGLHMKGTLLIDWCSVITFSLVTPSEYVTVFWLLVEAVILVYRQASYLANSTIYCV